MNQKPQKILAIFLFAVIIYFSGHTMVWLFASFAEFEWLTYFPLSESEGPQTFFRMIMFAWAMASIPISTAMTK